MNARERAEWRRKHWTGGVARSPEEMEAVDLDWWLAARPEDRLGAVFEMYDEQMALKESGHEAAPRLQRSVGGVRARRS